MRAVDAARENSMRRAKLPRANRSRANRSRANRSRANRSRANLSTATHAMPLRTASERQLAFALLLLAQVAALIFVALCARGVHASPHANAGDVVEPAKDSVRVARVDPARFGAHGERHPRVVAARKASQAKIAAAFAAADLAYPPRQVFVRFIKDEDVVELWGANAANKPMRLVKTFAVCARSGTAGPKRQQGDLQVPEGFYEMSRFNPWSSYHLSLGVSYPNASDRKKGHRPLGGDILLHGDCVTIGCIPIEDGPIFEH